MVLSLTGSATVIAWNPTPVGTWARAAWGRAASNTTTSHVWRRTFVISLLSRRAGRGVEGSSGRGSRVEGREVEGRERRSSPDRHPDESRGPESDASGARSKRHGHRCPLCEDGALD